MDGTVRLLLVEQHDRVREALVRRLQRLPDVCVVGAVADVASALQLVSTAKPDVVLLEPKGSRVASYDALSRLAGSGTPIIVWTSSLAGDEAASYREAGASAILLKETRLARLQDILDSLSLRPSWSQTAPGRAARVLVVEDEPAVREFLTVALCDLGYQAIAAPDGARALDLLDAVSPDVILLDLFMPVMSGFEFASVYRQRPGQHAPIVVCSAAQHRAAEVGAQASLAKPFSLHELASCVAGQISVP